ncbi:putative reverse transcriptase domain-containing protein [Tanacetum coccineum]
MMAATEPSTIQKAVQITGTLTDEALRNGSIKKNPEKRGNGGEPSKDRNGRDNNKRTRTGNAFATTANPVRREYTGTTPKNVNPINARNPTARACYECGSTDHVKATCPRNNDNQARGRAFMLGVEESRQDPNIMTEKMRHLRSTKTKEQKQEEIMVVRDCPEVFPNDLLGFPPIRENKFQIELVPEAILVAKSPYRLAPSKREE